MSKVLSIYNAQAFCEAVLPSVANTEYSFLLDAGTFSLSSNEVVELECIENQWFFKQETMNGRIEAIGPARADNDRLPDYGRYNLRTSAGEVLTILVEEKENPLYVYRKYALVPGQAIFTGTGQDNDIRYRYPIEGQVKSFVSQHHCCISYDGSDAFLEDTSSNGTYVNNLRVNGRKQLHFGDHIRIFGLSIVYLGKLLAVNAPTGCETDLTEITAPELKLLESKGNKNGSSARSLFRRAPRSVPKVNTETVSIDPPPNPRELANVPLFMQIGPAMTMTVPMLLGSGMTIVASRMSGGAGSSMMYTGIITAAASACIGIFWAVVNLRFNKKRIYEEEQHRFEKYGQYLLDRQAYIEECYNANIKAFCEKYISSDGITEYEYGNERLWNRNFSHSDVLTYRLGSGDIPNPMLIEVQKEKFTMIDDSLAEKPKMIRDRFSIMRNVPVCIDLMDKSLAGVIGRNNTWIQVIKNLIIQIAGNNSYTDVKIALVYDAGKLSNAGEWEFVKWLPHIWSEDRKIRFLATDKNQAGEVFYALGQSMRIRQEEEKPDIRPYYILFVLNRELLEGELISKYISATGSSLGLSTVIVSEYYEGLPNNCEFVIENNDSFSGIYTTTDENTDKIPVQFDRTDDAKLMSFAKRLANIEVNETENGGEIPASLTFFDMFDIARPEELNVAERWRRSKTMESMKALIGFKGGDTPCYLDIHERYHGPHGLVAGTTGSGKSETLQTYMLSLAINYSPDDVGFFIIDYKGGGMANLFEGLPHMIGAISNLSGNQVKRAMVSIKSENKRRQRIFTHYGVNNINAYTSLYKNGGAKEPIPHLLIIIDEFAELKREEGDFMKELVSVAQVGRSLGVHLILATQKPAGTVDDNIWSNSKFRLCLRVQDRQDSMDMLRRPDAAYLTQAGRGFLQVGNDELFELFQSGYSGAVYDEILGDKKLVVAQMLDPVGKVDLVGNHLKIRYQEEARHQWIRTICQAVEAAIKEQADRGGEAGDERLTDDIYLFLKQKNIDYAKNQYNHIRLKEFLKLFHSLQGSSEDDKVDMMIEEAFRQGVRLPERKMKSQLEAICTHLAEVALTNGYTHTQQLWMPVLPEFMVLTSVEGYHDLEMKERLDSQNENTWSLSVMIGKGDDPDNQNQMPVYVDFANNGNHAICGTVSTGRSTLLQTAIYALMNKYTAEEINLYILDFSSRLLTVFEEGKQVGGIMTENEEDEEKISKFFTMMGMILDERKRLLASMDYRDYVEHSHEKLPAVIIVIDNYAGFREKTNEKYDDLIKQLAKEGISRGIYLMVTAGGFSPMELPSRLAENFRTTICLEMSDSNQYSDVMRVVRVPLYPESNVKGRGLIFHGEKIIEFQTALAVDGESAFDRNDSIRKRIAQINDLDKGKGPRKIPVIPSKPIWEDYVREEEYQKLLKTGNLLPNGYDAETAAYSAVDLTSLLTYVVTGTKKSGKSTYMKTLIRACVDKGSDVYIIETGSSEFAQIAANTRSGYITDNKGIYDLANDVLLKETKMRAGRKTECMEQHLGDDEFYAAMSVYRRICIFLPDVQGFLAELYNRESEAWKAVGVYELLTGDKGYHYNFHFFAEVGDNILGDVMGYRFMTGFRDNGRGLRFGGKYTSQKLFTYANISYKIQEHGLNPGIGVVPCDVEGRRVEQVIVPDYRG